MIEALLYAGLGIGAWAVGVDLHHLWGGEGK